VPLEIVYSEYVAERQLLGVIRDVSEHGLRVQRLLRRSANPGGIVQLEFELPGTNEVIWAKGETCFDALWQVPVERGTQAILRPVRTSGVRLVAAATKHLRLIRDYVRALRDAQAAEEPDDWLMRAASVRA
jgi:hypothetical protein